MVEVEPITFIVRGFTNGHGLGDPFDYSFTLTKEGNVGYVHGLIGTMSRSIINELKTKVLTLGINSFKYQRMTKGRVEWKEMFLNK